MDQSHRPGLLTERERHVLFLVSVGMSSKEIARRLTISAGGANFHINNAMKKLGASTRAHAVALAIHLGIISSDPDREPEAAAAPGAVKDLELT